MAFVLDKWYLDLVTDAGVAVIGYVLDLRWLGLDLHLSSRLIAGPAARPDTRTALGGKDEVSTEGDRLTWSAEALGLRASWQTLQAPHGRTLLDSPDGRLEWTCTMPRAHATVVTAEARYEGLGYVEHLHLGIAPWALPFHTLRWGRHVSDRHSLVWIEWDGDRPLRAAWLDGRVQPDARVAASGVTGVAGARTLRWRDGRDLTRRNVGATIAAVAPALAARVAGRLARMREHKQLSPSTLVDTDGRSLDSGWAIHEVVTW